jgi:2',3'-cyclic-nucleotide 2'-phosphodiesterase (5'-nucleotidase family)
LVLEKIPEKRSKARFFIFKEEDMMMKKGCRIQGNPGRGIGIGMIAAALLLALVFTGCPTDAETEAGPDWGKLADWNAGDGGFVLGTATDNIDGTGGRYKETPLGNLIADGIAEYARQASGDAVDFALHNGQNLRVDKLAKGEITNENIFATIGGDTLYVVSYTGAEIDTLINIFVNSTAYESGTPGWKRNCVVLVSGEVSYTITPDADSAKPPRATGIKVKGSDLKPDGKYRVAVGNFIGAATAEEGRFPEGTEKEDLGPTKLSEAVAQYIYAKGTIDPPALGRISGEVPVKLP